MGKFKIAIVDDHTLFAESLESLINDFEDFEVDYVVNNGQELIDKLSKCTHFPDIILLDINMPIMNGSQTMYWLNGNFPNLKVLALSMEDNEDIIIKMLRYGAKGYLLKDIHPEELKHAFNEVLNKGFYYTDRVSNSLLESLKTDGLEPATADVILSDRERTLLKYVCTDKTYREIADEMCISPKTVDGYRDNLFKKFGVGNRIGLVLFALKNKLIKL